MKRRNWNIRGFDHCHNNFLPVVYRLIWSRSAFVRVFVLWGDRTTDLLRRLRTELLKRKRRRLFKIEIVKCLGAIPLMLVMHVVLSFGWQERFSCKGREWKIYCARLALSSKLQILTFTSSLGRLRQQKNKIKITKKRGARAARLFFLVQPTVSLIFGVVFVVAVTYNRFPKLKPEKQGKNCSQEMKCIKKKLTITGLNQRKKEWSAKKESLLLLLHKYFYFPFLLKYR